MTAPAVTIPRMAPFMAPTRLDLTPEEFEHGGDLGFALLSGRLIVGVVSDKTGEQITVRAVCKAPPTDGGRWVISPFDELHAQGKGRIFLDVPRYDTEGGADEIGSYDASTWTFTPARGADPARVWAALYTLLLASGRDPILLLGAGARRARIHASSRCIRCGKEIWLEQSVIRKMGSTCHGVAAKTVHQARARRGSSISVPRPPRRKAVNEIATAADFDISNLKEF